MEKEVEFNYHGISGNIFLIKGVNVTDQIYEMVDQYFVCKYGDGISKSEFVEKDIKIKEVKNESLR